MKRLLLLITICISSLSFGQNVYIPDGNFKTYLIGNSNINTNGDTEIQISEANMYTGSIDCFSLGISDLTGIEAFTSLTHLNCSDNMISTLDVSENIDLITLTCVQNYLMSSLDVSSNIALIDLDCSQNNIVSLNVNGAISLEDLNFWGCDVTNIDLSQNTALIELSCFSNEIQILDLSQNIALTTLDVENNILTCLNVQNGNNENLTITDISGNPWLTCIQVDDVAYSTANWTNIPATLFSEDCGSDCSGTSNLTELNSNQPKELIKIINLLGQEVEYTPNTILIYQYSNGTSEKVFTIEK